MMRVIDKNYQAIEILSNESAHGVNYRDHKLKTTLTDGLYTLEFKVHKNNIRHTALEVGNMIETRTPQGKQLLLTITNEESDSESKTIFAEDSTINLLNGFVEPIEPPTAPERLSYYVNHLINGTDYTININESDETKLLSFDTSQRKLERLREIGGAFNVEITFDTLFTPGSKPILTLSFYKKRQEYREEFRISTDDLLIKPERTRNIYNLATRMLVQGAPKQTETIEQPKKVVVQPSVPTVDNFVEKMVNRAFEIKALRKPYQWGGNGNPSWDCSGFMQACIEAAGQRVNHRATTYTMKAQYAPFKVIPLNDIKRGDLLMYDTGYTFPKDWNHVGLYLGRDISELGNPNTVIHAGNPVGITQAANSMKIMGAVRVTRP